ncbi:hypothetical protein B0H19DRAFT_637082 [Mycena capillaripes]|nr:hypothetical protein B0H19DRAFT_637082 [Mycena capillaripes]
MPATLEPQEQPRSSWWSLAQKSPSSSQVFPEKPHSHSKQSGIKFNTLATAMGFKQKKSHPPPLTIHEPYPPVRTVVTPPATRLLPRTDASPRRPYTAPTTAIGRAPSNSVSSFVSRTDSIEPNSPKTPEDPAQVRRGSLLTLSDADPFAARVVSLDPNRLSAFSNSSANDRKSSSNDSANRVSYASSSSQSFRLGGDLSPLSTVSPVSDPGSSSYMKLSNKLSGPSLRRKDISSDSWLSDLGGDANRLSQPDPPPKPRPAMRARGMTDGGIERTSFLRSDPFISRPVPSPKSSSPIPPSRKTSLSRPTPPPNQDLPPPPSYTEQRAPARDSGGSGSSTSLTFSTEAGSVSPRPKEKKQAYQVSPKSVESGWDMDVPRRTLKKSISHQSLSKRGQSISSTSSSTVPLPETPPLKVPRKQRSFQQHRLPIPAVPLQLPLSDQRASDPVVVSTRKRLFSGSSGRRPSQSTLALTDDARSLNTAPEPEPAASTSCWIDTDAPPRSPQEYTPQQIMSPEEMLQVEASVEAAYHQLPRARTGSIVSASTAMSDFFEYDFGLSPVSTFGGGRKRSNSDHPSVRSGTTTSEQDMYYHALAPQPPSPPILMSLPPPPRRTKSRTSSLSRTHSELVVTPLSPPPRNNSTGIRAKASVSVEQRIHRQSIMRKPSFLDIEDEMDKEPPPPLPRQASFLDLTRGSFDSTRSEDSDYN